LQNNESGEFANLGNLLVESQSLAVGRLVEIVLSLLAATHQSPLLAVNSIMSHKKKRIGNLSEKGVESKNNHKDNDDN
jgi:hypothetical protein